jgi:hypothetical protein
LQRRGRPCLRRTAGTGSAALPLVDDELVCEGSLRKAEPNMMGSTCFRSGAGCP